VVVVAGAAVGITLGVTGGSSSSTPSAGGTNGTAAANGTAALSTLGTLQPAPAPGPIGPEGVPMPKAQALAGLSAAATGKSVDGIGCSASEQTLFHIHAHLTIFVNGQPRSVPASIGIPNGQAEQSQYGPFIVSGTCFYWLHTHAADGIVHIESPVQRTYTLGNFFDEWGVPLGPNQLGTATGKVTVIENGKVFTGDPRNVPLLSHAQIQVEVGTPLVAPEQISWKGLSL
jgi:hypothetical protein